MIRRKAYRPFRGPLTSRRRLFTVIFRQELRRALASKATRRVLYLAFAPLIVVVIVLYGQLIVEQMTSMRFWSGQHFESLYRAETLFVVILMAVVGSDLVAKDVASGAIHLYFSRPVGRHQYLLGKLLPAAAVLGFVIVVPGVVLSLAQLVLAFEADYAEFGAKLVQVMAYGAVLSSAGAAIIVFLSSFGLRARYVGLAWVGFYFFSTIVSGVLAESMPDATWLDLVSVHELAVQSGRFFWDPSTSRAEPVVVLLAVTALCLLGLDRRLKTLERRER